MIVDKRVPVLGRHSPLARRLPCGPVRSHGTRRNLDAEFQPELVGDALFAPSRVIVDHSCDEFAQGHGNSRPARSRLPFPEQAKCFAMPTNQRRRLDNEERGFPIKEARPEDQGEPSRVRQSSWPDLVFLVESQLLAKEQVLGHQRGSRTKR